MANPFGATMRSTPHPWRPGRWRFEADGITVASAFLVPMIRQAASTWVLLQEEDDPDGYQDQPIGKRPCTPRLSLLGGKVGEADSHWVVTATREVAEETGTLSDGTTLLSDAALRDVKEGFRERCASKPTNEAGAFAGHISAENAGAMLVFYPVPDDFRSEWDSLPDRYASEFKGEVDHDKARHGTRLVWVRVRSRSAPHEACLDVAKLLHECAGGDPYRCASRCGHPGVACSQQGQPLTLKRVVELGMPLLAARRDALAQYLVANRLYWLLRRCCPPDAQASAEGRPTVGQLTHTMVSAWCKTGRLHALEKAMEQEAWLCKEVGKVAGPRSARAEKKRPRAEEPPNSTASPRASSPRARTLGARHLLVKCACSRNPVSKRTGESTCDVRPETAREEIEAIRQRLVAEGASEAAFAAAATERSDCSSHRRGGDLGEFPAGKMQRAFEEATRACHVGAMSPVVLSDSGYHLIWRYK